jgi:hypothetical protein
MSALNPTYLDIINEALGHLNVYTGDPLSSPDAQTAFFTLLALLDGWGIEPLTVLQVLILPFNTQPGKASYNVGTALTNDWVVPSLPMAFDGVGMMVGSLEIGLTPLTEAQYQAIGLKSLQSGIMEGFWANMGSTAHTIFFSPVPNAVIPVNLYIPQNVVKPALITALAGLPPGYQEAITFELVIKASSKFRAKIPAWIPVAWAAAKEKIRAQNFEPMDVQCDPALVSTGGRTGGGSIDFYLGK